LAATTATPRRHPGTTRIGLLRRLVEAGDLELMDLPDEAF